MGIERERQMTRKVLGAPDLVQRRKQGAACAPPGLGDEYAKQDVDFKPAVRAAQWRVAAGRAEYERIFQGSKLFDTRTRSDGGGAVDLATHFQLYEFKAIGRTTRRAGL
jgi:hypothetical protein